MHLYNIKIFDFKQTSQFKPPNQHVGATMWSRQFLAETSLISFFPQIHFIPYIHNTPTVTLNILPQLILLLVITDL